jgi:hypothetical protein
MDFNKQPEKNILGLLVPSGELFLEGLLNYIQVYLIQS